MKTAKAVLAGIGAAILFSMGPNTVVQAQPGLISVDLRNVANDIAKDINVDVNQIPATVQAPVSVATLVCGIAADVLGTQAASGTGSCMAMGTSSALDQIVLEQIKRMRKM
ncbi:hypothetical protein SAMN05216404_11622 [Nitrosospira multiformis]|uniref:Uncharacterized protein n=1 Tax=Nitrosospira multiformis TaxID=1231 RepID=A0A1H8NEW3_9PROT|nr:hypothetical protein [Nitrosospira multiformis]SEO28154.1 hypothetical protein SAMN05216404_11622 [Nitrosospira multiformis]